MLTEALEKAAALQRQGRLDAAARAFEAALALDPNHVETLNNLGSALATLGRHQEAIVHYQRALAIRPDLAEVHNNLGNALAALERHPRSLEHFRRAVALEPAFAEAHNNLADVLGKLDHHAEALACYQIALAVNPDLADAHAGLGSVLRTLGRIEEAQRALEKAVALAPQRTDFFHALGESKHFTADDPHLAAIERLNKDTLGADERMMLHFGLGKAYADLDRHADAFQHLLEANRLKRRQIVYHEQPTLELLERVARSFTADLLRAKAGAGEPSAVPVFIIGMPRSGSTLIEQILASHPDVFGAGEIMAFKASATTAKLLTGESFPDGVASWTGEQLRRVGAAYVRTLRTLQPTAKRITDKELGNFVYTGLIHLALPNARFVHCRRDPLDTCISCFSKLFLGELPYAYDLAELGRYYRAYEALMAHWRRVLPAGVMLEVHYEDVVADLEGQARRIIAHCGLAWDPRCLEFYKSDRPVKTASALQVRQPIYHSSVGSWRAYKNLLQPLLKAFGLT